MLSFLFWCQRTVEPLSLVFGFVWSVKSVCKFHWSQTPCESSRVVHTNLCHTRTKNVAKEARGKHKAMPKMTERCKNRLSRLFHFNRPRIKVTFTCTIQTTIYVKPLCCLASNLHSLSSFCFCGRTSFYYQPSKNKNSNDSCRSGVVSWRRDVTKAQHESFRHVSFFCCSRPSQDCQTRLTKK